MTLRIKRHLADIANEAYASILRLAPRQRRAALRALDGMSETNCGWTEFEMRPVLREFIRMASSGRCKARRPSAGSRPSCIECGMQLAEYVGSEGHGWICVACTGDDP